MFSALVELMECKQTTTSSEWELVAELGKYTHRNLKEISIGKQIKNISDYK